MDIKQVGQCYIHKVRFTYEQVVKFAELSGDLNPIHLDQDYASKTKFKKTIIHGYLSTSVFSKVFGTIFPGEGTIYIEQNLKFLAPMYPDHEYEAVFEVLELLPRNKARMLTTIRDTESNLTVEGTALILNREKIISLNDEASSKT